MAKIDLDAIERLVASRTDVADPSAVSMIAPGAVFEIQDELVRFPGDALRTWHEMRRVVVVQAHGLLGPVLPDTVSVVPCSASQRQVRRGEFLMPNDEPGFTKVRRRLCDPVDADPQEGANGGRPPRPATPRDLRPTAGHDRDEPGHPNRIGALLAQIAVSAPARRQDRAPNATVAPCVARVSITSKSRRPRRGSGACFEWGSIRRRG